MGGAGFQVNRVNRCVTDSNNRTATTITATIAVTVTITVRVTITVTITNHMFAISEGTKCRPIF